MKLYIANKNYSSWSLRAWLTLRMHDVPFEEVLRPFDVKNNYADFFQFSPTGKVPVLEDGATLVWESLAILEYVSDRWPQSGLWPQDVAVRAHARAVSHEMHAGFLPLRRACPMNIRRRIEPIPIEHDVQRDVARIETIWREALDKYGGPFLFGKSFCIADGMFAPVVNRFQAYALSNDEAASRYMETITSLRPWREWAEAARLETWVVDVDEVYA